MTLRLFALGGLGEIGMNCLALEDAGQLLIVDCGVTFDHRGLGIDVIHPEFEALEAYRDRISGVVVTHGHEDHIGALPYFLRRFDVPVFAPPYALALIQERVREHEILEHARLIATKPRTRFQVGPFEVEPIRVTHSIADATALAIETSAGTVIHTGDFKIDETPPDEEHFDAERFAELGRDGVTLLMSDSTNIDSEGTTTSERAVGVALEEVIMNARGAVVVAMFASNVHRLKILGEIARKTQRRIVQLGRSVERHASVARSTGYLSWPSDLVWPVNRVRELPKNSILAIATGTQGETRGALARLGRGEFQGLDLGEGDTVILSSRAIPGSEIEVQSMVSDLLRRGVSMTTWASNRRIHTSGHAHRGEQERMLELVQPRSFVPLHGTLHHLTRHAELARQVGVDEAIVLENGQIAEVTANSIRKNGQLQSGRVFCWAGEAIGANVLRERRAMAAEGVVVVVIELFQGTWGRIHIATRGVIDETRDHQLLAEAQNEIRRVLFETKEGSRADQLEAIRQAARRTFYQARGIKPMTVVHVEERA